jgi:hypothetical protein
VARNGGAARNDEASGTADAADGDGDGSLQLYGGVTWQPDGQAVYGFPRPSPGSQQPSNPLGARIGRALGWIFMDAASARFGTLLIGLVLARLMGPAELGVFGIAVVVLLAAHSIGQFGMGTALAVWRNAPERMAGTATTVALTTSVAVYAACYLSAPALAGALGVPSAAGVIRVMALSVVVSGLVSGAAVLPGIPHVAGVRTKAGESIPADLVVDMTGRRSGLPEWLQEIGARRPTEELEDSGTVYYGRHLRSADGSLPAMIGPPVMDWGTITSLALPQSQSLTFPRQRLI